MSKKQSLVTYDANGSAEEFQDVQAIVKVQKRHFKKGEFFMQAFSLDRLILEKRYNVSELRTLIALRSRLDFNNRIKAFRQSDIATEIGTGQSNVSKAIKRLEQDNIIRKEGLDYYFTDTYIKGAGD